MQTSKITVTLPKALAEEFRSTCRILELTQNQGGERALRYWFDLHPTENSGMTLAYALVLLSGAVFGYVAGAVL